mmetsp:Transcript_4039/g.11400  ORF Transcript_4039/g.11400 Transcript_4039/m.11400 type:complete len:423 (+) Transcript_4039:982-2250(+)
MRSAQAFKEDRSRPHPSGPSHFEGSSSSARGTGTGGGSGKGRGGRNSARGGRGGRGRGGGGAPPHKQADWFLHDARDEDPCGRGGSGRQRPDAPPGRQHPPETDDRSKRRGEDRQRTAAPSSEPPMQVMVLSSGKRVVTVAKDAKAPVPVQPAGDVPAMWHYLDPNSNEQGPFTAARILKWEARGHFDGSLKVRHSGASAWETLDHARPAMIRASEIQAASAAVAGGEHAPQPQTGMGLHGGQPQQPQPHSQPHQQPQPQPQPQPIQEQEQPTQQRQAPQQAPPQPSDWQQQYPKQQQQQRRQQQQAPPRPGEVYTEAPYNGGGLGGGRGGYERNGSYDSRGNGFRGDDGDRRNKNGPRDGGRSSGRGNNVSRSHHLPLLRHPCSSHLLLSADSLSSPCAFPTGTTVVFGLCGKKSSRSAQA